jgi:hypothetical protein
MRDHKNILIQDIFEVRHTTAFSYTPKQDLVARLKSSLKKADPRARIMIVYKVDAPVQRKANAQIRDMAGVLSEIAPTLRILRDLIGQHQNSLSIDQIDKYRSDLRPMIDEAIQLTHMIAFNSQRLSSVSEQVTKQLDALNEQVSGTLQNSQLNEATPAKAPSTETSNEPTPPARASSSFTKTFSRV